MGSRATSYDSILEIDNVNIYPNKIGEIKSEEAEIEVSDNGGKYVIPDQVKKYEPIEIEINKTEDRLEYDLLEKFYKSRESKDIVLLKLDGNLQVKETYFLEECQLIRLANNAFDRDSKSADIQIYKLCPRRITEG